jgi:hypothetical protein
MSWLDKLFRRDGDVVGESAGGVGVWASDDEHRSNKQQGDRGAPEVPGGAPVDGTTPDERREEQR